MPSGKVHDRITMLTAAVSLPVWWMVSPAPSAAINAHSYVAGVAMYLFSGFYLSDDLDTKCVALKRWGPLQFIWTPYQKLVPHRHWISHGLCVGPILRVAYFLAALWLIARGGLWLVNEYVTPVNRDTVLTHSAAWLVAVAFHHPVVFGWALAGLVLGGVVHTVADSVVSGVKRVW